VAELMRDGVGNRAESFALRRESIFEGHVSHLRCADVQIEGFFARFPFADERCQTAMRSRQRTNL